MKREEKSRPPTGEPRGPSERVEYLVSLYVDRLVEGETLDFDDIVIEHPDVGEEVISHLKRFVEVGGDGDDGPPLGTLGDYSLRRPIGRGGMGVVYEAWENSIGRPVALKVLPAGIAADTRASARFLREAQAAGKLNHPNVVSVYSMGVTRQTPYYAMEYIEGQTLAQLLKRQGEAPDSPGVAISPCHQDDWAHLAESFADVADGLQHAHARGVVHRDVKPSNLIVDQEGRLRILDFGLARLEGQEGLTLSGDFVGTPAYMSPEQAKRRKTPVDHRTDIYSLGATLYELLTRRQPFRGEDHAETLSQIIERAPRPPRQLNSRVPADLETIVLKCLRKDAADRYGTAEALGQDLRRFARGDPIEARPEGTWEKTGRQLRRHRNFLLGAGTVLILTTAALIVSHTLVARARDEARYDLYVSNMRLAMEVWESGDFRRFVDVLEEHIPEPGAPDLRGWEWYYLASIRDGDVLTITPEAGPVRTLDWSPDGRRIAVGSAEGTLSIWETTTWEKAFELTPSQASIESLAWSPESERLAVGTAEGTLTVYVGESGDRSFTVQAHDGKRGTLSIAWSADGARLASAGSKDKSAVIRVWHSDGQPDTSLLTTGGVFEQAIAWSPDGSRLALAHSRGWGAVALWDTRTWEKLPLPERQWHQWRTRSVAWSPAGDRLATGGHDQRIYVWDTGTWDEVPGPTLRHRGIVFSLAFSPDGDRLASAGGEGIAKIWDLQGDEAPLLLRGHAGRIATLDWSPDGRLLATGSEDGTVRIWNSHKEPGAQRFPGEAPVAWSRDGRWLAVEGESCNIDVYDASSGTRVSRVEVQKIRKNVDSAQGLAFGPDGRLLAISVGNGDVEVWDWRGHAKKADLSHGGSRIAWSPDGRLLATCGRGFVVGVWDVEAQSEVAVLEGKGSGPLSSIVWSPNGKRLAAGGVGAWVRVWDAPRWDVAYDLRRNVTGQSDTGSNEFLAFSPGGDSLAAGSRDGELIVWDMASGDESYRTAAHSSEVICVSWSPDGHRIATGGEDTTVKIWDAERGVELLTLRGHTWTVFGLAWHPDGRRLLSADGVPNSTRVWDARRGFVKD